MTGEQRILHQAEELLRSGHAEAAEQALVDYLRTNPQDASAFEQLARIERALRRPQQEMWALQQCMAAGGSNVHWLRLGALRRHVGDTVGAAAAFERATRLLPDEAAGWRELARLRFSSGDQAGTRDAVDELRRRFPDDPDTPLLSAHLHKAAGDAAAAHRDYLRALERRPDSGEALFGLVDLGAGDDALLDEARRIADDDSLPEADRVNAAYAAARILDRADRFEAAFRYFRMANDLARDDLAARNVRYEPRAEEAHVDATMARYPPAVYQHALPPLEIGLKPIFVVGLPRSGTTLVEQILAAHPTVESAGEVPAARECERWFEEQRRQRGSHGPPGARDAGLLDLARQRYIDALIERCLDAELVVDKLPGNFMIAGFLRLMFPDSPIVHCVRDPRAIAWSLYSSNFADPAPYSHDLNDLAHFCRQYLRLMDHWQRTMPRPPITVTYEALVEQPEAAISSLLGRVELASDPACFDPAASARSKPIFTASHRQVRQPIYTHAIDRWRRYEQWLEPLSTLSE